MKSKPLLTGESMPADVPARRHIGPRLSRALSMLRQGTRATINFLRLQGRIMIAALEREERFFYRSILGYGTTAARPVKRPASRPSDTRPDSADGQALGQGPHRHRDGVGQMKAGTRVGWSCDGYARACNTGLPWPRKPHKMLVRRDRFCNPFHMSTSPQRNLKSFAASLDLSYRKGIFCPRVTAKERREIAQAKMENEAAARRVASGKALKHFDRLCAKWERQD